MGYDKYLQIHYFRRYCIINDCSLVSAHSALYISRYVVGQIDMHANDY